MFKALRGSFGQALRPEPSVLRGSSLPLARRQMPFAFSYIPHVPRATRACTFSTSQLPKPVRPWCALRVLTWKCASRHNCVHLFISHLPRWHRTRYSAPAALASLLFDRPEPQNIEKKNAVFRGFATLLPLRAPASSLLFDF